jgi:hypothetical protein
MTDQLAENNRPSNVGDDSNLPPEVRAVAGLRSLVVAWTTRDPKYEPDVPGCSSICTTACLLACFPMLLFFPLLLYAVNLPKHSHIYWILTETELRIVKISIRDHFPEKSISGGSVHTVPLDNIVACGVKPTNWSLWSHIYVEVSETTEDAEGISDSKHTTVGLALAGQEWLAREILHRRDTLQITGSTTVGISLPSPDKYSALPARFGTGENAPDAMVHWAQQGRYRIFAWTTLEPPKTQGICLVILMLVLAVSCMFFALFLSSPVVTYMVVRFADDHPLLPPPVVLKLWIFFAVTIVFFGTVIGREILQDLQDNYWVVTETDLWVLSKRLVPFRSLDIKRQIPLSCISRCFLTAHGHDFLDRWGSWPSLFVGTTGKEKLKFAVRGGSLAESAWFLQQILDQRDALRSLEAVEVFA